MTIKIATTHNGPFHCDDVVAAAILTMRFPNIIFNRTRDKRELDTAELLFDVGGEYDPSRNRYDHHQRGRAGERENGVQYSSAGLIWKHFAPEGLTEEEKEEVDRKFICPIDAVDNGQKLSTGGNTFVGVPQGSFSGFISSLNPGWQEEGSEEAFMDAFLAAVNIAVVALERAIKRAEGMATAKELTTAALESRKDPRVMVLDRFHPWQEWAVQDDDVLFCVFPDARKGWRIQTVGTAPGSFESRQLLPEAWGGLNGAELEKVTGVAGTYFCHPGRFIMGTMSLEGAIEVLKKILP